MLTSKIEIFFGKFAIYIIGAMMVLATFMGAGWYVSNVRLEGCRDKSDKLQNQLEVSNASYSSIKSEYQKLTRTLEDNQKAILANQEIIKTGVAAANTQNQTNLKLENELHSRKTETDCQTPKDLRDAWSKL